MVDTRSKATDLTLETNCHPRRAGHL